jgi:hypothetical protein
VALVGRHGLRPWSWGDPFGGQETRPLPSGPDVHRYGLGVPAALAPEVAPEAQERLSAAAETAAVALHDWVVWVTAAAGRWGAWQPVGPAVFATFLTDVALVAEPAAELRPAARAEWDRAVAFEELEAHRPHPVGGVRPVATSAEEQCRVEEVAEAEVRAFTEARRLLSQASWPGRGRSHNRPRPAWLAPLAWLGVTGDLPYFYRANAVDPRAGIAHEGAHCQQLSGAGRRPIPRPPS